jgi:hypothetical protein
LIVSCLEVWYVVFSLLQVRLRVFAPLTLVDMTASAIFCIHCGMSWQAAVLRYGCCLTLALLVNIHLSRASRANFIEYRRHLEGSSRSKGAEVSVRKK